MGSTTAKRRSSKSAIAAAKDGSAGIACEEVSRAQLLGFLAKQPPPVVAMEACATAHDWGRAIGGLRARRAAGSTDLRQAVCGRQKNDAADAEAIAEAASRPTMRFVALKTEEQQARSMISRTRDLLVAAAKPVGQRAARLSGGAWDCRRPRPCPGEGAGDCDAETEPPHSIRLVRELGQQMAISITLPRLDVEIAELDKEDCGRSCKDLMRRRSVFQTMPGWGRSPPRRSRPLRRRCATFRRERDFAAWLGLVPRQHTTGGTARLGRTSKVGQRDIRRLLIIGAMSVVRWAVRKGAARGRGWPECWPKSRAWWWPSPLASKMARSVWAMLSKGEDYRGSALAPGLIGEAAARWCVGDEEVGDR